MKMKINLSLLMILCSFYMSARAQTGESLFKGNCAVCHSIGKGKLVGPDLSNVTKRREESWLLKWITSSQSLVKSGDTLAVRLFEQNGKTVMPNATVNETEIKSILAYISETSDKQTATVESPNSHHNDNLNEHNKANALTHAQVQDENEDLLSTLGFGEYILIFLICLMVVVMWVIVLINKTITEKAIHGSNNKNT